MPSPLETRASGVGDVPRTIREASATARERKPVSVKGFGSGDIKFNDMEQIPAISAAKK